ncbi:hypothetical protein D3C78_650360 [compost metagenome]
MDAHRHPLDDLDPVAGSVLRRQQGEGAAGTGAEAVDGAAVLDVAAVQVGNNIHRLANAHVAQLGFLEVGVDPQLVQGDHRHGRGARLQALAQLHGALGHVARDRRHQGGAGVVQIGLAQFSGSGHHLGVRRHHGVIDQRGSGVELLPGIAQRTLRR